MRCDTRLAVIIVAAVTIILSNVLLYKASSLHQEHKKGDGKQHRAYNHELLQKSISTLTEKVSIDEKIKFNYDDVLVFIRNLIIMS